MPHVRTHVSFLREVQGFRLVPDTYLAYFHFSESHFASDCVCNLRLHLVLDIVVWMAASCQIQSVPYFENENNREIYNTVQLLYMLSIALALS